MDEYDENSIRADVRGWIDANWDPNAPLVQWRSKLADSGWGMPTWPKEWFGKDLPQGLVPIVDQEFSKSHAIGVAKTGIRLLAAATLLEHGTQAQKKGSFAVFLRARILGANFLANQAAGLI